MPSSVNVGGMRMSVSTTSGGFSSTAAKSAGNVPTAPSSSMSSARENSPTNPSRSSTLSSATNKRTAMGRWYPVVPEVTRCGAAPLHDRTRSFRLQHQRRAQAPHPKRGDEGGEVGDEEQ